MWNILLEGFTFEKKSIFEKKFASERCKNHGEESFKTTLPSVSNVFLLSFSYGGDPARGCEGRPVPSIPPLPWPTLLLLNFKWVWIFENCAKFRLHFLKTSMLCKKHSEQGRSNLFASRLSHYVRDDNPFLHLPAVLSCGSCYFDELYSFSLAFFLWRGPSSELRRPPGPLHTSPSLVDAIAA